MSGQRVMWLFFLVLFILLSKTEYKDLLESVVSECEMRLDAVREELQE